MKQVKKAYVLNICIACLELFAVCWMISGLKFSGSAPTLSASRFGAFKYFTVDSNILMGIVACIVAVRQKKILEGKETALRKIDYILILTGTVGVTLTMLVTCFYLAPTMKSGWLACFTNSNFFLHLINPLISIYVCLRYEKNSRLELKDLHWGLIPLLVYAIYYIGMAVAHAENNVVPKRYDFYGFFAFGVKSAFIVFPIIFLITVVIDICLYKLSHISNGREEK